MVKDHLESLLFSSYPDAVNDYERLYLRPSEDLIVGLRREGRPRSVYLVLKDERMSVESESSNENLLDVSWVGNPFCPTKEEHFLLHSNKLWTVWVELLEDPTTVVTYTDKRSCYD